MSGFGQSDSLETYLLMNVFYWLGLARYPICQRVKSNGTRIKMNRMNISRDFIEWQASGRSICMYAFQFRIYSTHAMYEICLPIMVKHEHKSSYCYCLAKTAIEAIKKSVKLVSLWHRFDYVFRGKLTAASVRATRTACHMCVL